MSCVTRSARLGCTSPRNAMLQARIPSARQVMPSVLPFMTQHGQNAVHRLKASTAGVAPASIASGRGSFTIRPIDGKDASASVPPGAKVLHMVRHAQGTHNVEKNYRDADQKDAVLTPFGVDQCKALATETAKLKGVELLITSPMTRCIQTALHSFTTQMEGGVPLIALETVRETVNFTCDRRRRISEIQEEFPMVDFSHCSEEDIIWDTYAEKFGTQEEFQKHRESDDPVHIAARARAFFQWLGDRPEREFLLSSHSAFMWHLFNHAHDGYAESEGFLHIAAELSPVIKYEGGMGFEVAMRSQWENCEMRSMLVLYDS